MWGDLLTHGNVKESPFLSVSYPSEDAVEEVVGQCNVCGWQGAFLKPEMDREGTMCRNCSASSRHRAVVYVVGTVLRQGGLPAFLWAANKTTAILESSARGSYPVMFADKFDYYAVEYDPAKIAERKHPREYADFQKLHYADQTFDLVIASDVFEHVRRDEDGYREIHRVLKKGGTFVMTVPYDHDRPQTVVRVDTTGKEDVHLMEPEYHGGGGHTLTYRSYGRDLLSLLRRIGYSVGHLTLSVPAYGITRQSVIVATKGDFIELTDGGPAVPSRKSLGMLVPFRLFLLFKYNLGGFMHYGKQARRK